MGKGTNQDSGSDSTKQGQIRYFKDEEVRARERVVDTSGDAWSIGVTEGAYIRFLECGCDNEELIDQLKYVLAKKYLPKYAVDTVSAAWSAVKAMLFEFRDELDSEQTGDDLREAFTDVVLNYIDSHRNKGDESSLNRVRQLYGDGCKLKLPLFDKEVWAALKDLKFTGNEKGLDVRIYIPNRSPLNENDLMSLRELLKRHKNKFDENSYSYASLAVVWLFIALGCRPRQLALLYAGDLTKNTFGNGKVQYLLNVPSVKRRNSAPRTYFKLRPIPSFLGLMLEAIISANKTRFMSLGVQFDPEMLPIFPVNPESHSYKPTSRSKKYQYVSGSRRFYGRTLELIERLYRLDEKSGKTVNRLHITPRRLRKTYATHAAACGVEPMYLMDLLDHSDLQHVMVYYQLGPGFAVKLGKVYEDHFSDIFEFFKGTIDLGELVSRHESSEVFGPDSLRGLLKIGYCTKESLCSLAPPYSCYTCRKFEACNDKSVHMDVLDAMQSEIQDLFRDGVNGKLYTKHIAACEELVAYLENKNAEEESRFVGGSEV